MKPLNLVGLSVAAFALAGCANKPLQHTYEGDVHLRLLEIKMEPLELHNSGVSGDFAKITRIQKIFQSFDGVFNEQQNKILFQQLNEFQEIIVQGIRDASEIPLVASEAVDIAVGYDNYGQLVSITFEYPWEDGAYMNLYGNVYYSPSSSIGYGIEAMNRGEVKVRPTLQLQIDGRTANKELFWRHSARYESNVNYRFGNQFILGLAMKRMEEGEIFLAPLAKGLSNELRKKKARGEL